MKPDYFRFLSDNERGRLEPRLEKIGKKYGLDADNPLGNQCRWLYSLERRQAVRKQRIALAN
jgi:hypothetical protein